MVIEKICIIYKYIYIYKSTYKIFLNSTLMRPPHFYERGYAHGNTIWKSTKQKKLGLGLVLTIFSIIYLVLFLFSN